MADILHKVEEEVERDAELVADKTGMPTSVVLGLFLLVAVLVVGGLGACVWRFLRKRRITKDQVKKAQDEQGLVEGEEEPENIDEEPLKVSCAQGS